MAPSQRSVALVHHRIAPEPPPIRERLTELLGARDLCVILIRRELQVRYKQTALGVIWILLQPLVPALIFAIVFGSFARLPSGGAPYLLFAISGLVLYGLFASTVSRAGGSLIREGGLIAKIYFPRAVLPLASGLASLVDFGVGLAVIIFLMVMAGQPLGPAILAIPLILILTISLALGLGLAVAALSAHYRDVGMVVPFVLQLLLYGSPVVYSMEVLPRSIVDVFALNPLVPLLEAFRWSLLGTAPPTLVQILLGSVTGIVMLIGGILIFARTSRDIADVV